MRKSAMGKGLTANKNRNIISKSGYKCLFMFHKDGTYNIYLDIVKAGK